MRITYKGDYALKAVLVLSVRYGRGVVTIHELVNEADMPIKFLEQVLLELKRGGFVESKRGKVGGYFLAKHPSEIKVGDIVRFVDGPIEPITCVEKNYSGCRDIYKCAFRGIWQDVSKAISSIIDNITFEDLAGQIKRRHEAFTYSI
jgi:Rrf2 family protein